MGELVCVIGHTGESIFIKRAGYNELVFYTETEHKGREIHQIILDLLFEYKKN